LHDVRRLDVVFVTDVSDDFLDQVLDGDHACGAAVFVDDERGLEPVGAQLGHQVVAIEGGWHFGDGLGDIGKLCSAALAGQHFEDLLDVDKADGFVKVTADDGKPGVAALHRGGHQIGDGVVGFEHLDLGARCHQLFGNP
jgi:hypothetical protein